MATAAITRPGRAYSRKATHEARVFWLCVAPWVIGFILFTLGPMIYSLYISFTEWGMLRPPEWVGMRVAPSEAGLHVVAAVGTPPERPAVPQQGRKPGRWQVREPMVTPRRERLAKTMAGKAMPKGMMAAGAGWQAPARGPCPRRCSGAGRSARAARGGSREAASGSLRLSLDQK